MNESQRAEAREKYAGALDRMWLKANIDPKKRHHLDEEIRHYERAYRAYIWVQMAERSPLIFAAHLNVPERTYHARHQEIPKNLRAVALEDVLANDSTVLEILKKLGPTSKGEIRSHLDMIRDTRQEKTPDYNHRCLYARIGVLDHDLEAVQQLALGGGTDRAPRNILDSDFDKAIIKDQKIYVDGKYVATISLEERKRQAREYYKIIRKRLLGDRTATQWFDALGLKYDVNGNPIYASGGKLVMSHADDIDSIFRRAGGALLNEKLASRTYSVYMGTADSRRDMYDWPTLGSRHWARRANDLEAWQAASTLQIQLLNEVKAHPDKKTLLTLFEKLFAAEQEHDPAKGEMKVWLWAGAVAQMYREGVAGKIPIIGRILPKLGVPVSVMQHIKSADSAVSWSANNCHEWAEEIANVGHLSATEIAKDGSYHPFNQESLEKWIGGTKTTAMVEFLIIGGALILTATATAALLKGLGDTSEERSH